MDESIEVHEKLSRNCIPDAMEKVMLSVVNGISLATGAIRANVVGKEPCLGTFA